tara:strand:+ start:7565 stop:8497 length:933 start_codon:yes stop_codon:yes gene_type:complete
MHTAVLFLVFNRPETTTKVFEKIRQVKPPKLYIAGDGPRENHKEEEAKVKKVREIVTKIDWHCEVKTLFRKKNLGCKKGVGNAISWFFEHEEQGIILEDDCLAHKDFFNFCENLLDLYSKDKRIASITGNNFQNGKWRGGSSYYFSKYNHCWGWATWRRAWKCYQADIAFWPKWSKTKLWIKQIPDKIERNYWEKIFNVVYDGKIDSWAYPWTASVWYKGGLTITPNINLVSNIGFGKNASHTKTKNNKFSKMQVYNIDVIEHPKIVKRNIDADFWTFNYHYEGKYLRFPQNLLIIRIIRFILSKLKKFI